MDKIEHASPGVLEKATRFFSVISGMERFVTMARDETKPKKLTPKQIRARARRRGGLELLSAAERKAMIRKPVEEWDLEELAKGRPKDKNGHFSGAPPGWITREIHEQAMERFREMVRTDMQSHTVVALKTIKEMLENDDEDDKGKPVVPAGVKADLAKFLIEHLVGKPKQPIEADINLKLQGILGSVLVQPRELLEGGFEPSASHRTIDGEVVSEEDEDE